MQPSRRLHPAPAIFEAMSRFVDRPDAGRKLAAALAHFRERDPVVVGIARGGVLVAEEVAHALGCPLDVVVLRDIGAPRDPAIALAAVAPDASYVDNDEVRRLGVTQRFLSHALVRATWEVRGRDTLYRGRRPRPTLNDRTVLLIDDGTTSTASLHAAIASIRKQHPREVYLASPVCAPHHPEAGLRAEGTICVAKAEPGQKMAEWYRSFPAVPDDAVIAALHDGVTVAPIDQTHPV